MAASLTVGERIIFHLSQYTKYHDSYDVPIDISQDGIAAALRISRAHAALELKKLKDSKDVAERLSHIKKGRTKRKAYFLTPQGEKKAKEIMQYADVNAIDLTPFQDIRKCKGPELWDALDDKFKPVVAMSCVFRKPFRREVLPDIATSLLPVDERGMVDLPLELKEYVVSVTDPEKLKDFKGTIVCAGNEKSPTIMCHFMRPVEGGCELRSRFWMGWHVIGGKPVKMIPDGVRLPLDGVKSLLTHNIKEFTNLAAILPEVYSEFIGEFTR